MWESFVAVTVDVKNTGNFDGSAVPQLYLSYPEETPVEVPVRVLRGFQKVQLGKGEQKSVEFHLTRRDLSYWDVERQNWVLEVNGRFQVSVGSSSRDLPLSDSF